MIRQGVKRLGKKFILTRLFVSSLRWKTTDLSPSEDQKKKTTDNPEATLISRAKNKDEDAFRILVELHQSKVYHLLLGMVRDEDQAQELTQETFVKAWKGLPSFRGDSTVWTWLYRIAINTARNWMSSSDRKMNYPDTLENKDGETFSHSDNLIDIATPESSMVTQEIVQTVNEAIETLPEDLRMAIVLRELEGLSYEEIAQAMACPVGTVRSRIFRAREAIAAKLKPVLGQGMDRRW